MLKPEDILVTAASKIMIKLLNLHRFLDRFNFFLFPLVFRFSDHHVDSSLPQFLDIVVAHFRQKVGHYRRVSQALLLRNKLPENQRKYVWRILLDLDISVLWMSVLAFVMFVRVFFCMGGMGAFSTCFLSSARHSSWVRGGLIWCLLWDLLWSNLLCSTSLALATVVMDTFLDGL